MTLFRSTTVVPSLILKARPFEGVANVVVTPDTPEAFAGILSPLLSDFSCEEGISSGHDIEDEGD